eukprot:s2_g49.t1
MESNLLLKPCCVGKSAAGSIVMAVFQGAEETGELPRRFSSHVNVAAKSASGTSLSRCFADAAAKQPRPRERSKSNVQESRPQLEKVVAHQTLISDDRVDLQLPQAILKQGLSPVQERTDSKLKRQHVEFVQARVHSSGDEGQHVEFVQARVHSSGDEGWSGTALDLEAFAREEGSILEESPAPFQPEREAAVVTAIGRLACMEQSSGKQGGPWASICLEERFMVRLHYTPGSKLGLMLDISDAECCLVKDVMPEGLLAKCLPPAGKAAAQWMRLLAVNGIRGGSQDLVRKELTFEQPRRFSLDLSTHRNKDLGMELRAHRTSVGISTITGGGIVADCDPNRAARQLVSRALQIPFSVKSVHGAMEDYNASVPEDRRIAPRQLRAL